MRLWLKLALAMVAVSLAPLAVVSIQAAELTSSQAEDARKAALEREAVAVADEIGRWVRVKAQAVAGWVNLYPDLLERPPLVQQGLLRAVYRAVPGAVTVALLDQDGLAGEPGAELPPEWLDASLSEGDPLANRPRGSDARAQAFLQRVQRPDQAGQVRVGRPYVPPASVVGLTAEPALPVAARGPFGDPAVLAVELVLDEIDDLLSNRAHGERAFALVLTSGEPVIAHGPPPDGELLRPLLTQDAAALDFPEEGRVGAVAKVPGVPWAVVMTEPREADNAWARLRTRLLVALGVSLVVAALAGIIVARSLSRPVAGLRTAALKVADGDLRHRVPVDRRDELGELATAFNHMAARLTSTLAELEARQEQVERFNEELQDRVRERTRELEAAQRDLVRAGQLAAVAEVGAGLAHELNNPLASVLGLLQVLKARAPEEHRGLLAQAEAEAWRCREVADAMLRVSRADEVPDVAGETDLGEVVREAGRLVDGAFNQRGVKLVADDVPGGLRVRLSQAEALRVVTQVLQALCAGLPADATLHVGVARTDDVELHLTPDASVATGSERDDFLAAGLGLWVAQRLLDARGGRLEPPGESTGGEGTWRLVLPAA